MSRAPRAVPSHARRKKVLKQAKGFRGRRKNNITTANAAVREHGLTYGRFICGLGLAGIVVDRKILADLAVREPEAFKALVTQAASAAKA